MRASVLSRARRSPNAPAPCPSCALGALPQVDPKSCSEQWAINCSGNYGYAHMDVMNATHVHWRWDTTSANGDPADWHDEFWVVKA